MSVHEKQSVTKIARGASPSGSSSTSSSSRGRIGRNKKRDRSEKESSWLERKMRREKKQPRKRGSGDGDDDDDGGCATYCPCIHSLFQFKLKPQKSTRHAHAYGYVIYVGVHTHTNRRLIQRLYALSSLFPVFSSVSPGLSLVFVHVEGELILSNRKYYHLTNAGSAKGIHLSSSSAHVYIDIMHRWERVWDHRIDLIRSECVSSPCRRFPRFAFVSTRTMRFV